MASEAPLQPSGSAGADAPMIWRRACVACTKAKRQCTKQVPSCRRCAAKRIPCAYPPPRPNLELEAPAASAATDTSMLLDFEVTNLDIEQLSGIVELPTMTTASPKGHEAVSADAVAGAGADGPDLGSAVDSSSADQSMVVANIPAAADGPEVDWFLAQSSFVHEKTAPDGILLDLPTNHMVDQMLHLVDTVKKWLREWVTDGHSPLHHRQLYHNKMPRCVQDAYSTMALYFLARGSANQNSIFQLVDDRVTQLFEDQLREDLSSSSAGSGSQARDLFSRLSRVQALVAYQMVRLFDGDIRMRARAEADIPTLTAWTRDLWTQTRRSVAPTPGGDASTSPLNQSIPFDGIVSLDAAVVTWKLWILTESIRRTWLVANLMMEVYHYIKHGWSKCPGSIAFTMRAGLWGAETAWAWSAGQRRRGDALFVPIFEQLRMMDTVRPSQVDEFGHALLGMTWGLERMARWHGDGMGGRLGSPLARRSDIVSI
ncbi:hypothetical protein PG991_014704 [Apiospora marii]|uniref:Zn(2)-C6 fungal-type domain-containing protein n=1 Tax=Apiospora marii TaxID=335849 RepID=A0ABR1R4A8_9PEZI